MADPTGVCTSLQPTSGSTFAVGKDVKLDADWDVQLPGGFSTWRLKPRVAAQKWGTPGEVVAGDNSVTYVTGFAPETKSVNADADLNDAPTGQYFVKTTATAEKKKADGTFDTPIDLGYKTSIFTVGAPTNTALSCLS
jgi:hypothetical protein